MHRGSGSKNIDAISKKSKKLKKKERKPNGYWSNPHAGGSGSPERLKGVGLIRIH